MSVKNFAGQMKATIEQLKAKGTAALYCDNIIAYLDSVISSPEIEPTPEAIEQFKAEMQGRIEYNKQTHESNLEMFRSVITSGQNAIRASLLLNGGAAVALLAFISHLATDKPEKVSMFAPSIVPFAYGALAIVVTAGLTYLSQWLYANDKTKKAGFVANIGCIFLGLASYGFFVWGLCRTYAALNGYPGAL